MKLTRSSFTFHTDGSICPNCKLEDYGCSGHIFLLENNPKIRIEWPPNNSCPRCGYKEFYDTQKLQEIILENISFVSEQFFEVL